MTFGYLNLGNPKLIGDTEAQEMKNASIDQGYLSYKTYETNKLNNAREELPNGKIVVLDGVTQGQVKWKDSDTDTARAIGLDAPDAIVTDPADPDTTISRVPTVLTAAYASNPYAEGTYNWALTFYDPDTGEESPLTVFERTTIDHSVPGNEIVEFTNFPLVSDVFPDRPNLQWRIYRMPLGGTEYNLVNHATVISANVDVAGPYQDTVEDQTLGIINDSFNDVAALRHSALFNSIAVFNDHLFVGGISPTLDRYVILFSRPGKWWAFPPKNELNIKATTDVNGGVQTFKGFCNLGETLLLFGGNTSKVLYGDNKDNFAMKDIDFELTATGQSDWYSQNTQRVANNVAVFSVEGYQNVDIEGVSTQIVAAKRIAAFDGAKAKVISTKIENIFPLDNEDSFAETSVLDNRFYTIKYIDLDASLAALAAAGRTIASATTADYVYLTLVFDSFHFGWTTSDDSGAFVYRTKEYSQPRTVEFHKRIWIEAEGNLVLELLGDGGTVVSTIPISLPEKKQIYLKVKAYRSQTFLFRFTGQPNCKIYDFGVDT